MRLPSLQNVLYVNAFFSTVCAVATFVATDLLVSHVLSVPPLVFQVLGIGLVAFALFVFMVARATPLSHTLVMSIFIADVLWLLATPVLLIVMAERIPSTGIVFIIEIAVVVAVLATLEWQGLRRLSALQQSR
ncbi:MAG: hypothetical protein WBJ75_07595 [Pseudohongiellaceae bacterium]